MPVDAFARTLAGVAGSLAVSSAATARVSAESTTQARTSGALGVDALAAMWGSQLSFAFLADRFLTNANGAPVVDGEVVNTWWDARSYDGASYSFAIQPTLASRPKWIKNAVGAMPGLLFEGAQSFDVYDNANQRPDTGEFNLFMLVMPQRGTGPFISKNNYAPSIEGYAIGVDYRSTTFTATTTSGSAVLSSVSGVAQIGAPITGTNIPIGNYVASVSGSNVTMANNSGTSPNATGSTAGVTITQYCHALYARANDGTTAAGQSAFNYGKPMLVRLRLTGTACEMYVNGYSTGVVTGVPAYSITANSYAATIDTTTGISIGSMYTVPQYGRCIIGAVVAVKGTADAAKVKDTETALKAFWGIREPSIVTNYRNETSVLTGTGIVGNKYNVRIPAIVKANGKWVLFYENRQTATGDTGHIGINAVVSASATFTSSTESVVVDDGTNTSGNPTPIVDASGRIHLFYNTNLAAATEANINTGAAQARKAWYVTVDVNADNTITVGTPVDISATACPAGSRWHAFGPGGFTVLDNGRIMAPFCYSLDANNYRNGAVYSDNGGSTFALGFNNTTVETNETAFIQFNTGKVYFNARRLSALVRKSAYSNDRGATLLAAMADDGGQVQIRTGTQMSALHYGTKNGFDIGLMCGPGDPTTRGVGMMFATLSEGSYWASQPFRRGYFGYSSMWKDTDGSVVLAFESTSGNGAVAVARFDLGWPAY